MFCLALALVRSCATREVPKLFARQRTTARTKTSKRGGELRGGTRETVGEERRTRREREGEDDEEEGEREARARARSVLVRLALGRLGLGLGRAALRVLVAGLLGEQGRVDVGEDLRAVRGAASARPAQMARRRGRTTCATCEREGRASVWACRRRTKRGKQDAPCVMMQSPRSLSSSSSLRIASWRWRGMILVFLLSRAALPASSRISAARYSRTAAR